MKIKPDRARVIFHLKTGQRLRAWVPTSELVAVKDLTDQVLWHVAKRELFVSNTAKYYILGSNIAYVEVE